MKKTIVILLAALWLTLSGWLWFGGSEEMSESERRKLAQFPELSVRSVLDGSFMTDFEDYTLDQFPLRDSFRRLKALFHYKVLGQKDNHGIYIADGYAAQLEYPLNEDSVSHALSKFNEIYEKYLAGSKVVVSVVPDKGYYLAEQNGYLSVDYETLFETVREGMSWADYVDITNLLSVEDYYRTDTHWRQEKITDVAERLCEALGVDAFAAGEFTSVAVERPFYGVYCGQTALPMEAENLYLMEHEILESCTVYNHETGKTGAVYDSAKLGGSDLYEIYLSGPVSLLTVENPNAASGRELIVFRDSFGSSLIPLLLRDYATVTVVDIRYISSSLLDRFVDFHGQDVLFLYSTLVLNNSTAMK